LRVAMSSVEEPEWLTRVRKNDLQLTALDLGWMRIGVDGAKLLAVALGTNNALTSINLGSNLIGVEGARSFAAALGRNTTLTSINLGYNNIGNDGARYLAAALEKTTTLTSLNLMANKIGDDGQRALLSALEARNFTLCELWGVEGVDHLLERNQLIMRNRKLKVPRDLCVVALCLKLPCSAVLRRLCCWA
jgi:Ran GTPase-activating protein (RanGAP) involved in mRNA processing and transport